MTRHKLQDLKQPCSIVTLPPCGQATPQVRGTRPGPSVSTACTDSRPRRLLLQREYPNTAPFGQLGVLAGIEEIQVPQHPSGVPTPTGMHCNELFAINQE